MPPPKSRPITAATPPLVDTSSGNVVASYTYDEFGNQSTVSESFPGGWTNPYRYDGRDRVRYDAETGDYWMRVRAYDPTLGRFLAHDPYARTQAMDADNQPFVYAGNNPLVNVDPSGLRFSIGPGGGDRGICESAKLHSHWWGFSLWMNHCFVMDLETA